MSGSVRTEIGIGAAEACRVAESSAEVESTISEIARSSMPDEEGRYVEEFTLNGGKSLEDADVDEVFSSGAHTVYQFEPNSEGACVCRTIESFGCPISNLHARDGVLYVSFHAPDIETVQGIVSELQDKYDDVHVRHLARAHDSSNTDFVFVDRGRLTDKQRDVLETAHEMGYFDHPKGANSEEVADELGISPSTFCEHLAAAQRKVLDGLLRS